MTHPNDTTILRAYDLAYDKRVPGTKMCHGCGQRLPSTDFDRSPTTRQRHIRCRPCRAAFQESVQPPSVVIDDDFGHWLAGFIDGEGCFTVRTRHEGFFCELVVWVRDDDRAIIEEIADRTRIGSVIRRQRNERTGVPGHPLAGWIVRRKHETIALVALLDRYPLRAKKARDYAIWREAVLLWELRPYGRGRAASDGWPELAALKQQLEDVRRYQ